MQHETMERRQRLFLWRQQQEEEQMAIEYALHLAYWMRWIQLVKVQVQHG